MMIGNNTFFVDETQIDPASPFTGGRESQFLPVAPGRPRLRPEREDRRARHGAPRRSRDEALHASLAGAFRNAYDHAFNLDGELFTFDSDMEWDIGMPWYREIRTVHVVPGGDYGYRNGSGKLPAWASRQPAAAARRRPRIAGRGRVLSVARSIRRRCTTRCSKPTGRAAACSTRR